MRNRNHDAPGSIERPEASPPAHSGGGRDGPVGSLGTGGPQPRGLRAARGPWPPRGPFVLRREARAPRGRRTAVEDRAPGEPRVVEGRDGAGGCPPSALSRPLPCRAPESNRGALPALRASPRLRESPREARGNPDSARIRGPGEGAGGRPSISGPRGGGPGGGGRGAPRGG